VSDAGPWVRPDAKAAPTVRKGRRTVWTAYETRHEVYATVSA
jgi:hypothetical protein